MEGPIKSDLFNYKEPLKILICTCQSSLHKAEIINRKSLKRIKHVNGKYVVVQRGNYDENQGRNELRVFGDLMLEIQDMRF